MSNQPTMRIMPSMEELIEGYDEWRSNTTPNAMYHNAKDYTAEDAYDNSPVRLFMDMTYDLERNTSHLLTPYYTEKDGYTEPRIYEALYVWERKRFEDDLCSVAKALRNQRAPEFYNAELELPTDIAMFFHIRAHSIARYWSLHVDDPSVRRSVLQQLYVYQARVLGLLESQP